MRDLYVALFVITVFQLTILAMFYKVYVSRVARVEAKMASIGDTILPISMAFQAILIKELTHFHTPEMDALLVKIGPPFALTIGEEARLATLLTQRAEDMGDKITQSEREAATILPAIMRRARVEAEKLDLPRDFKMQIVAAPIIIKENHEQARKAERS